jgi:hypothetical protein
MHNGAQLLEIGPPDRAKEKLFIWKVTPEDIDSGWDRKERSQYGCLEKQVITVASWNSIQDDSGKQCGPLLRTTPLDGRRERGNLGVYTSVPLSPY